MLRRSHSSSADGPITQQCTQRTCNKRVGAAAAAAGISRTPLMAGANEATVTARMTMSICPRPPDTIWEKTLSPARSSPVKAARKPITAGGAEIEHQWQHYSSVDANGLCQCMLLEAKPPSLGGTLWSEHSRPPCDGVRARVRPGAVQCFAAWAGRGARVLNTTILQHYNTTMRAERVEEALRARRPPCYTHTHTHTRRWLVGVAGSSGAAAHTQRARQSASPRNSLAARPLMTSGA